MFAEGIASNQIDNEISNLTHFGKKPQTDHLETDSVLFDWVCLTLIMFGSSVPLLV